MPNALSVSPAHIRMRLLDDKVQHLLSVHNIALQAMFSHYANAATGTLSYSDFKALLRECDIPPSASYVEKALSAAFSASNQMIELTSVNLYFHDLCEVFGRIGDLSSVGTKDLASNLGDLLQHAWQSFTARVPAAAALAASIAASHQAAANALGNAAPSASAKKTGVKFA
jgi:hypothetical protein